MESQTETTKCPCGLNSGYYRSRTKDWHCTKCGRNTPMKSGDSHETGPKE